MAIIKKQNEINHLKELKLVLKEDYGLELSDKEVEKFNDDMMTWIDDVVSRKFDHNV